MSANSFALRAEESAGCARVLYPDGRGQLLLAGFAALSLGAVAIAFPLEDMILPWQARMDATTPGWCFVLAEAGVLGFVAALAVRAGWMAVIQGLMVATLVGYTYAFAGASLIDERRALQISQLIFRAVELGLVSVAALAVGATVRLVLRQRLLAASESAAATARQYCLADLMFLVVVFAIGLGFVNLFFDHFDRESQILEVTLAVARTLPATLPWLWGVTQRRLSLAALLVIVAISLIVMLVKMGILYSLATNDLWTIFEQSGRRAVAYAVAGTASGLVLRGLGFQWRRG